MDGVISGVTKTLGLRRGRSGRLARKTCHPSDPTMPDDVDNEVVVLPECHVELAIEDAGSMKAALQKAGKGANAGATKRMGGTAKQRNARSAPAGPEPEHFKQDELNQVRSSLLSWYDANHRVLPWRRTPHSQRTLPSPSGTHEAAEPAPAHLEPQQFAYYVWVSEIMLQQTQVATVIPYFLKWIAKWPTVKDLAAADVESVNAMWAGLGYYRRARYLLDGAQHIMNNLDGLFPTTAKDLLCIPGVGAYTSAAVASIAFGDPSAVVDGNVVRVISRLRSLGGDPTTQGAVHAVMAQQLLDKDRPGDFNQAVMELGARVCKPQAPDCASCPAASICNAYKQWQDYLATGGCPDVEDAPKVTNYPGKKEVKAKKEQLVAVCVLELIQTPAATENTTNGGESNSSKTPTTKTTGKGSDNTAASTTSRKRQATLFDFAPVPSKVAKAEGDASQVSKVVTQQDVQGVPSAAMLSKALADDGQRLVLLVQRPAEGLLAGLWELPCVSLSEEMTYAKRKDAMNTMLCQVLGTGVIVKDITIDHAQTAADCPSAVVVRRHEAGSYVHVFSHIRQTNYVERLVLMTDDMEVFKRAVMENSMALTSSSDAAVEAGAHIRTEGVDKGRASKGTERPKGKGKGIKKGEGVKEQVEGEGEGPKVLKWVCAKDFGEGDGVSTGPLKMYALAAGSGGEGGSKSKGGKGKSKASG